MNRRSRVFYSVAAMAGLAFLWSCGGGKSLTAAPVQDAGAVKEIAESGSSRSFLGDVFFHRQTGKEIVSIIFSKNPSDINLTQPSETTLVLTLKDTTMAGGVRNRYIPEGFSKVRAVSLRPLATGGRPDLEVAIDLADVVPYRLSRSESAVVISFDTAAHQAVSTAVPGDAAARQAVSAPSVPGTTASPSQSGDQLTGRLEKEARRILEQESLEFRGDLLSIVCQDANIKNVFRLISEVSGYSIISGPDVNQKVTLHMRNVPWDQALETVLEVNKLGMTKRGRVITVMPLEEIDKAEEKKQARDVAEGRVRQISIEAKIVEVSTSFSREIGVRWGYGYLDTWGRRDIGMLFGSSARSDDTSIARLPNNIGVTNSNIAVNFPSMAAAINPALGIIAGSSKFILDATLQALETTGEGKIISSPKVTTVENKTAVITQGEQIPILTRGEEGSTPEVEFKDAVLSLAVTPQITAQGKLSMIINAGNDYADWARAEELGLENPPIITNRVESTVIVEDGSTIVIGGVYKSSESGGISGIPWLSKIPVLGWLFKYESIRQEQRELLIFITPLIID